MSNTLSHWMICYDIHNKRTLSRVCRYLKDHALHVQLSVFYTHITQAEVDEIFETLTSWLDPKTDDLRIYQCYPFEQSAKIGIAKNPLDLYDY